MDLTLCAQNPAKENKKDTLFLRKGREMSIWGVLFLRYHCAGRASVVFLPQKKTKRNTVRSRGKEGSAARQAGFHRTPSRAGKEAVALLRKTKSTTLKICTTCPILSTPPCTPIHPPAPP